jgi:hypothetical protein
MLRSVRGTITDLKAQIACPPGKAQNCRIDPQIGASLDTQLKAERFIKINRIRSAETCVG